MAALVHVFAHLPCETTDHDLLGRVGRRREVVNAAEALVGIQVRLLDEGAHGAAQRLGQHLGMEAPQQLEVEVYLHVEVVQPEVAEVAVEEGVVGDLVEGLAARIAKPVVETEVVAQQAASSIRSRRASAEKPPNTTECAAPIRAHASIATGSSGIIGMENRSANHRTPLPSARLSA